MDEKTRITSLANSQPVIQDSDVAGHVVRAIAASGRIASKRLEVTSSQGVVMLRGRVPSYYHKQVAQALALSVIGACQLVNDIEVT